MPRAIAIFRKDARHLWPHITIFLFLMALAALLDPTYTGRGASSYTLLSSLLPLACWSLVIVSIHEEKLPGDRQYWLTRPISWKDLLAAKALFVIAFINLPLMLFHLVIWLALGIPPLAHLPALLWKQVFFAAFYILPVALLAAVTRNIGQVIMAALLILVPAWLITSLLGVLLFVRVRLAWLGFDWLRTVGVAAVLTCGIAAVLVFQYSRRRTALARTLAAAVALAALAVFYTPLEKAFAGRSSNVVRISLDSRHGRPDRRQPNGWNTVGLEIPVRIEGLPRDVQLRKDLMAVEIESPAAGAWRPSLAEGGLHEVAGDQAWLTILVSKPVYMETKNVAANVSGALEYTLFGDSQTLPPPQDHAVVVPRIGVCSEGTDSLGKLSVVCYSPFPQASLYLGTPATGANWIVPMGYVGAPVPTAAGFQPLTRFWSQLPIASWKDTGDARLIATRPLARVDLRFEFRGIRMADYGGIVY